MSEGEATAAAYRVRSADGGSATAGGGGTTNGGGRETVGASMQQMVDPHELVVGIGE